MTDKDIKDYCKNCNVEPPTMRFKCPECEHNLNNENNFAKDINVPHEEQIIIDGVQFNKFGDFFIDYDFNGRFRSISSSAKEYKILKSLIEQLIRKTQECEELKNKIKKLRKNIALEIDTSDRYRKALEEIKKVCLEDTYTFADGKQIRYDSLDDILDIINKAKE